MRVKTLALFPFNFILSFLSTFLVCFIVLAGCNNGRQSNKAAASLSSDTLISVSVVDNSMNSLDWQGTYSGTVPCADCAGIETSLTLKGDNSFSLKTNYIGKPGSASEEKGNFSWNNEGNTISLSGITNKPNQYFVGENKIIQLDLSGNRISGDQASNYILNKQTVTAAIATSASTQTNAPILETYWRLTELMGKPVAKATESKKEIFISLKKQENRLQAFTGCNTLGGMYELPVAGRIKFSKMMSTLKACPDMSIEMELSQVLETTDNYVITGNQLILNKARMAPLARFEMYIPQ